MNLYTKQIEDKYIRENFEKIEEAFNALVFTLGDFKFFEFRIEGIQDEYKLYHQLGFNPNDVLVTKAIGSSFEFVYTGFTDEYLTIKTTGDLYLRMFIGNMRGDEVVGANAFANVTDDLGDTGGSGGGTGTFYKKDIIVGSTFLSDRDIILQGAPITNSERVYINGLIIDDSNYTISGGTLTMDAGLNLALGDKIYVRFAS
jgi:hypothetical protein